MKQQKKSSLNDDQHWEKWLTLKCSRRFVCSLAEKQAKPSCGGKIQMPTFVHILLSHYLNAFYWWRFVYLVKARECTTHNDCSSIQHTSCVRDGSDRIMRCLCGNNKAPVNGGCQDAVKRKWFPNFFYFVVVNVLFRFLSNGIWNGCELLLNNYTQMMASNWIQYSTSNRTIGHWSLRMKFGIFMALICPFYWEKKFRHLVKCAIFHQQRTFFSLFRNITI